MVVCPVVVGVGQRFFPDSVRLDLELVQERRFCKGVIVLQHAVRHHARFCEKSQIGQPPIMLAQFESRKPKACGIQERQ